jgi:hypothetical protein
VKPGLLKFVSLERNDERQQAYITALRLRDGNYDLGPVISSLGLGKDEIPRFLQLVIDAMKGKPSKFDLTPTGIKIVEAWEALHGVDGSHGHFRTLSEIKTQYAISVGQKLPKDRAKIPSWLAGLEDSKKIPDDWTFRVTLDRVRLPYAKDKRGAPPKIIPN